MDLRDIAIHRLHNQHLAGAKPESSQAVVRWLGAVQSQDYAGAKWAVGQRTSGLTDAGVEQSFNDGDILRTHVLRPTWHFVTPQDIRWLLALTAARVHALNGPYYRKFELDAGTLSRGNAALEAALQGGQQRTRAELKRSLEEVGISADSLRLSYLMMFAELEGLICSGARQGNQFTYALLDDRVPSGPALARDAALAELARRYFNSHGPGQLADFVWWSGMTVADAKAGLEAVKSDLQQADVGGQTYWFGEGTRLVEDVVLAAYLLPNYDECLASYKDHSPFVAPEDAHRWAEGSDILAHHLVVGGRVAGSWQRTIKRGAAVLELRPFTPLIDAQTQAVAAAAARYGDYLGMPVVLV